jgi:hypothetical protein
LHQSNNANDDAFCSSGGKQQPLDQVGAQPLQTYVGFQFVNFIYQPRERRA